MTDNATYVSRRDRRRAARKSLAGAHAASAGRATAAVLAASGLVISSGVAANAADDSKEGRDSSTVQLNASELSVERASNNAAAAVTASNEAELSFDRPAVSSEASPERVAAEEAAAEQAERDEAAAEQAARDAEAQQAADAQAQQAAEAQAQQEAEAQQAAEAQAQQEAEAQQAAEAEQAQQQQAQPAQQTQQQSSSNSGASTAGETEQQQPASSGGGGRSGVVGAAYGLIGISWSQMDCSAMVQNAYASAGISVPRDTYGQMTLPQVSSPAPGDIVISNGGGHAAIYIGNGQVISSTASQGIRVHGLHEGWHNVNSYHRPG